MREGALSSIFNARRSQQQAYNAPPKPDMDKPVDVSLLGYEQKSMFEIMESGNQNMFITGKAGTGKSYLLDFFVANTKKVVVVAAPTGVAAINVGGQTIHSLFQLPLDPPYSSDDLTPSRSKMDLFRAMDALVIDEVSMVRADVMDAIDKILRKANDTDDPFGGKQMIFFGDLYQLPPVAVPQVHRYLDDTFGGIFFFNAPAIYECRLEVYELTHIFRQEDPTFIDILNQVREGNVSEQNLSLLNRRADISMPAEDDELAIIIAPRKDAVEKINEAKLDSIDDEPLYTYEASITGDIRETEFPTQKTLQLKVGARVMMLKNDLGDISSRQDKGRRWVNGTLGQVSRLSKDSIWVMINDTVHQIDRAVWNKTQYSYDAKTKKLTKQVTATFEQFPVTLAWAITVHKAQGATYRSVGVDMDKGMFAIGQTYVALSRCADMNRLYLTRPIGNDDILTSSEVKEFLANNLVDMPEGA